MCMRKKIKRIIKKRSSISQNKSKYLLITKTRVLGLLLFLVITFSLWWLFLGGAVNIKHISCKSNINSCTEQISAELSKQKGKSLLTFKAKPIENKLKKAVPSILNIEIKPLFPNKLQVQINYRKPVALIKYNKSKEGVLVDKEGLIFKKASSQNGAFGLIITDQDLNLTIGEKVNDQVLLSAIKLVLELKSQFISFQKINVSNREIELFLSDNTKVLFSYSREIHKQVTSLQQILSQATIQSKPTLIDVRFNKPVIKFD